VINLAAPLSLAVAKLAPPQEAPLTTTQELRRSEKKRRKNFDFGVKEIQKQNILKQKV